MADKSLNPALRVMQGFVETGSPMNIVQGIPMAPGVTEENLKDIQERFTYRDDDLFIATPGKCGTAWIQQIVKLIRNNGVESGVDSDVVIPWFEVMTVEEIEAVSSPRIFMSHLPPNMFPKGDPKSLPAKFISSYRNLKDVSVSAYYMMNSMMKRVGKPMPFDAAMIKMLPMYEQLLKQMKYWWLARDSPNILLMCYEDMKKDLTPAVTEIATFMGYNLTDDVIKNIVEATTFDKMKNNPVASKKMTFDAEFNKDGSGSFVRKGIVGDWKNHLSEEQSAMIDALVEKHIAGTGLVFQYE